MRPAPVQFYYLTPNGGSLLIVNADGLSVDPEGGETQAIMGMNGKVIGSYYEAEGLTTFSFDSTAFDNDTVDWYAELALNKAGNFGALMLKIGTRRRIFREAQVQPLSGEGESGGQRYVDKVVIKTQPGEPM